jgi:transcriptional regulator with XRE-family HTH domain
MTCEVRYVNGERLRELGSFLRACRGRLSPETVGVRAGLRQRAGGLRREQVAQLAGISATWYTRLEQGRGDGVSVHVLENVAESLALEPIEREYLFALAGPRLSQHGPMDELVPPLGRLLDTLHANPGYLMGPRWDVLAWNEAAHIVLADFAAMPLEYRNVIWLAFTSPAVNRLLPDWQQQAQGLLADFRLSWARHVGDPAFADLISRVRAASAHFARWWDEHDVRPRPSSRREYDHPHLGRLVLELNVFRVHLAPDLRLVVFTPLPEEDTIGKIESALTARSGSGGDEHDAPGAASRSTREGGERRPARS